MEKDTTCAYCMEGELVARFGIKICEMDTCKVYLFKEQSHPGRVILAHKKHVGDMTELTAQERAAYLKILLRYPQCFRSYSILRRLTTELMAIQVIIFIFTLYLSIRMSLNGAVCSL